MQALLTLFGLYRNVDSIVGVFQKTAQRLDQHHIKSALKSEKLQASADYHRNEATRAMTVSRQLLKLLGN